MNNSGKFYPRRLPTQIYVNWGRAPITAPLKPMKLAGEKTTLNLCSAGSYTEIVEVHVSQVPCVVNIVSLAKAPRRRVCRRWYYE